MPPIEFGPAGPRPASGVGAVDASKVHTGKPAKGPVGSERAAAVANPHSAVVRSRAVEVEAGEPQVDTARVAEIAKAIEQDRYPVVPMRVADAMIAAGILLRSGK